LGSESVYIGFSLFIGLNLMKKNWGGWKLSSLTTRGLCCSVKFYTCHVQFDLEVMNGRDGGILSQLTVLGIRKWYTGGPRILWFLVPKGYHEIWGSRILKPSLVLKSQIGSKIFLKSPFLAIFHEIIRDIFTESSSYSWKFRSRC